ncbi:UNVERIFIED_CONTAM: electron transport complex protein RnfG [Acetivibrio alkalicellulosi]
MRDIIKHGFILFVVCATVTLALAFTYSATKERIDERILEEEQKARERVMNFVDHFEEIEDMDFSLGMVSKVFNGIKDSEIAGRVFLVEGKGYGGKIQITVGIDNEGRITGVNIGDNSETPGLGTKITHNDFLSQFIDITPKEPLVVVKNPGSKDEEIDAASGATVSSKAVVDAVQAALDVNREIEEIGGD